jgi:hypothetical protein
MTFFNKKEEVIDVQLTSEGRRLLSQGRFKPTYYEFYDDDIIYDIAYTSGSEIQNLTQDRILDETIYPKLNARFQGAKEKGQVNYKNGKKNDDNIGKNIYLNESPFLTPLASYDSLKQEAPYFEVRLISDNENPFTTGSSQAFPNSAMSIPQYNITSSYLYYTVIEQPGTIYYREDPLIIEVVEKNTQFTNFTKDFDIEIYEVTGSTEALFQPKYFLINDEKPRTEAETVEYQLQQDRIRYETPNLIDDNLLVLLDEDIEKLFPDELVTVTNPSGKTKVVCEEL